MSLGSKFKFLTNVGQMIDGQYIAHITKYGGDVKSPRYLLLTNNSVFRTSPVTPICLRHPE